MRADARRNRVQILAAAREVFVEQGVDAPLESIAQRAGVGIATLYRRFPDRTALIRQVAIDSLGQVLAAARVGSADECDAWSAFTGFLQRTADLRIGVLMPMLLPALSQQITDDVEFQRLHSDLTAAVQQLIVAAQAAGRLRADLTVGDVLVVAALLTRPLPGMPEAVASQLPHRHLQLLIEGLGAPDATPLPGPALGPADFEHPPSACS